MNDTLAHEPATVQREYSEWSDALATDTRDSVMVALNRGYVESLEIEATLEAMRFHQRECRATYITAFNIDLWLGQQTAFGEKWGVKR